MGKNSDDISHLVDRELASGATVHRFFDESHTDLSPVEVADLRDHAATQTAFDAWWSSRPAAQANWYAARTTAWKAAARDLVLLLET